MGFYSPIRNRMFWNEVENLPLKQLHIISPCPALVWSNGEARLPTSLRSITIEFSRVDGVLPHPIYLLRQLPNLESLDMRPWRTGSRVLDLDEEAVGPVEGNCLLCQ